MKQILLLQIPILFLVLFTKLYMHHLQAHQCIVAQPSTFIFACTQRKVLNMISNRRKRRAKVFHSDGYKKIPYYQAIQNKLERFNIRVRVIKVNPIQKSAKTTQTH